MNGLSLRSLLFVLFVLGGAAYADAQTAKPTDALQVCGIDLKLGMKRDDVLKAVALKCESKRNPAFGPDFDELWVLRTTQAPGPKADGYWTNFIYFLNGELVTVSKEIGSADNDAAGEIVNQIYIFSKIASDDGELVAVAPSSEFERDGWRYRVVTISAGKSTLTLQTSQPIGKPNAVSQITLQESLSRRNK